MVACVRTEGDFQSLVRSGKSIVRRRSVITRKCNMHHVITAATSGEWAENDTTKRFQLNYRRYRQRQIFNIRGEIASYYLDAYFTAANLEKQEEEITFVGKVRTIVKHVHWLFNNA